MRNLPLIVCLGLSACVIIPASELDERKAGFGFSAEVLAAAPSEAFQCDAPGVDLSLRIDGSMAGVQLTPTVVIGDLREGRDPFVVPSDGEVTITIDELPSCASGSCIADVGIELTTAEGAATSTTVQITRYADPEPRLVRAGLLVDGEPTEGDDLIDYLADSDGWIDPREATALYAVVSDSLLGEGLELGLLEVVACPPDVASNDPDCERLDVTQPPGVVGGDADERVLAVQLLELGEEQCDSGEGVQLHARLIDAPCDEPFSASMLATLRVLADCDGDQDWVTDGDCDDTDPAATATTCDDDGDGYVDEAFGGDDCDDELAAVHPDADEACDGVDTDCVGGATADEVDDDGDGYVVCALDAGGWLGDGKVVGGGDCDDAEARSNPGAVEVCEADNLDTDCDGNDDVADGTWVSGFVDGDGDGWGSDTPADGCLGDGVADNSDDCDDAIYETGSMPMMGQPWGGNPLPNHCRDLDMDGYGDMDAPIEAACPGPGWTPADRCTDCNDDPNDGGPLQVPGSVELCDGVDQNCDPTDDHLETDDESDGYVECAGWVGKTKGVLGGGDCDDTLDTVYPSATELCDGVDQNCDGADDYLETDDDGDGFVECANWVGDGSILGGGDCDEDSVLADLVNPAAVEVCDGVDTDCDGNLPADEVDDDVDGVLGCFDCDDNDSSAFPGAFEIPCDGIDQACDGLGDEADADGDGYVVCDNYVGTVPGIMGGSDCDEVSVVAANVFPGAPDRCDGADNDCDPYTIDGVDTDVDGDGSYTCDPQGEPTLSLGIDCDDDDPNRYPGNVELCDGIDQNCDAADDDLEDDFDGDFYVECAGWQGDVAILGGGDCDDTQANFRPGRVRYRDGNLVATDLATAIRATGSPYEVCGAVGSNVIDFDVSETDIVIEGVGSEPARLVDTNPMGGAISVFAPAVGLPIHMTLRNLTISGGTSDFSGGAVGLFGSLTLDNVEVTGCDSYDGAVVVNNGTLELIDTTIHDNVAIEGGGVRVLEGQMTMVRSSISDNDVVGNGGGVLAVTASVDLDADSSITGNYAAGKGGGVHLMGVANLSGLGTISGNEAQWGGAVAVGYEGAEPDDTSTVAITDVTIADNDARSEGGGIAVFAYSDVDVVSSELQGNDAAGDYGSIALAGQDILVAEIGATLAVDGLTSFESSVDSVVAREDCDAGCTPEAYDPTLDFPGVSFSCDESGCTSP